MSRHTCGLAAGIALTIFASALDARAQLRDLIAAQWQVDGAPICTAGFGQVLR